MPCTLLPQNLPDTLNLTLRSLLLIRPTPDPQIRMNPHNALLVQHPMRLPDNPRHLFPTPFNSSPVSMHAIFQPALFQQLLHLRDVGRDGGGPDAHGDEAEVGAALSWSGVVCHFRSLLFKR